MGHRKKLWKKIISVGLLALTLLTVSGTSAYASGNEAVPAVFPVRQIFDAENKEDKPDGTFEYVITALEEENPMPKGSADGGYLFFMKDTEDKNIGPVYYSHGGVYRYQIRQCISREQENYTYDKTIYTVEVYVKNRPEGLAVEMIILNEEGRKCENMEFENKYTKPAVKPIPGPEISAPVRTADASHAGVYALILLLSAAVSLRVLTAERKIRK